MKKSQIFKKEPSLEYFTQFVKNNFYYDSEKNEYISNINTYKKLKLYNKLDEFINYIKPFYFNSKVNYPINANNIKGFNVVIRQLCKFFQVKYYYKIQYFHSNYDIVYYIML